MRKIWSYWISEDRLLKEGFRREYDPEASDVGDYIWIDPSDNFDKKKSYVLNEADEVEEYVPPENPGPEEDDISAELVLRLQFIEASSLDIAKLVEHLESNPLNPSDLSSFKPVRDNVFFHISTGLYAEALTYLKAYEGTFTFLTSEELESVTAFYISVIQSTLNALQ